MANSTMRVPAIWTTGWTDELNTGTWRNDIAVHQKRPAPCHGACPLGGEIPEWIQQVCDDDVQGAWLTLIENNPIPAAIGRTCHRPCEGACNRREYDGAVSINALEQYVGDVAIQQGWTLPSPALDLKRKVAVVGGGPAGLSCAYQLRRKGFQVTLYDANPELGGVLRYGVPEFRLPKTVVDAETRRIIELGIQVVSERKISARDLDALEKEYAAVFVAFGAPNPKRLPQFPKADARVIDAIDFLRSVKLGAPMALGKTVVVIGGGSVAMDVAGSALRLKSTIKIVALESRDAMPAEDDEIQDVLDEGAVLIDGAMVKSVESAASAFKLHCARANLDPNAPAGVIRPVEIKNTGFELDADTLILAVGQDPELADWEASIRTRNNMVTIDERYMTSRAGVFAAGDVANAERFVSTAVGDGKRAAQCIASYLGHAESESVASEARVSEVSFADINTFYFPTAPRCERSKSDELIRRADFREIRLGFSTEQAQPQAQRCFSCGNCIECDNCVYFCPDMAVEKDASSPLHYRVLERYCKGCGCCVEECPRGAMLMQEETK